MPKKSESNHSVRVGNPVLVVKNGLRFIGICQAIDSRIDGGSIIEEVKVQCVAVKENGMEFFIRCTHDADDICLFEMKEVFPLLVSPGAVSNV